MNHPQNNNNKKSDKIKSTLESLTDAYRKLGPYLNIGYTFAVSVILFTFLGWYADKKWGTAPWLTVVGAVLGITVGFYNFFKTVLTSDNNQRDKTT